MQGDASLIHTSEIALFTSNYLIINKMNHIYLCEELIML